jgi:hypothetical protein
LIANTEEEEGMMIIPPTDEEMPNSGDGTNK